MNIKEKERIQESFKNNLNYDELLNCTRCGFCLPSCPTFIETKEEFHSPRGRIALMKGVADGLIEPSKEFKRSLDLCLGCRACEPACPSGVKFGHLLEQARDAFYQNNKKTIKEKIIRKVTFNNLFPYQNRMIHLTSLLSIYQRSSLQKTTRKIGFLKLFPNTLQTMEKVLPKAPNRKEMKERSYTLKPYTKPKKKVAFFIGCLMDTVFRTTNNATIKLLQYAGCEIAIPKVQGCCGALNGHSGELDKAKEMAKRNITAFEDADVDYIIINAGGCGAFLQDYNYLLKDEPIWKERAEAFSAKIKDITRILIDLKFDQQKLELDEQIVTYQDSCHLRNGQNTFNEPRKLLQSIKGVKYVEMNEAARCCGSAGIYNIVEPDMSMQILDYKMKQAVKTKAKTIVTANPGCLLQMKLGIEKEGLTDQVDAVHIVDLLLKAFEHGYQERNEKH